jgi:hypothetical protein
MITFWVAFFLLFIDSQIRQSIRSRQEMQIADPLQPVQAINLQHDSKVRRRAIKHLQNQLNNKSMSRIALGQILPQHQIEDFVRFFQ